MRKGAREKGQRERGETKIKIPGVFQILPWEKEKTKKFPGGKLKERRHRAGLS